MKPKQTFADRLKKWRSKLGIAQPRAATLLNVKLRTLQSWEQQANTPSVYALDSILARMKEISGMADVES